MSAMASQIARLMFVYSIVYSGADKRKHQSSASLAFVRRIHRWPVNSPHKRPVTRKMFPFDDVIICRRGYGPLTRYRKLPVAHALGMPGMFSPPPTSKETASYRSQHASRHVRDARAVMHDGNANSQWRGKRYRHSRRMHNPQFYVSGKRPIVEGVPLAERLTPVLSDTSGLEWRY